MVKVSCPFCNSKNTFNISYGYLKEKKIKKNYVELDTNINYRKSFKKYKPNLWNSHYGGSYSILNIIGY